MLKLTIVITLLVLASLSIMAKGRTDLDDLDYLGDTISQQVQEQLKPLQNLGSNIAAQVQQNLKPLENLGSNIQKQVYQNLKPVRDMQSRLKIRFGQDGTSVVNYKPSGKTYIVRDGQLYECHGTISADSACSGNLERFDFKKKEDYCYAISYSSFNDWYCFTNGNGQSGIINGKVICESNDNRPALLIRKNVLVDMCSRVAQTAHYKYYTNNKLEDVSSDVHCNNGVPQECTMTVNLLGSGQFQL